LASDRLREISAHCKGAVETALDSIAKCAIRAYEPGLQQFAIIAATRGNPALAEELMG
jgi:hypothetical protein